MTNGRILVLDDEEKMASLLARSLARSGYEATACSSSAEALELLKSEPYDVLVTDLRMPGMDGIEILERARQIDPGIDVILMTAYASVQTVREALKRGAVDYLEKPVSAEEELKPLLDRLLSGTGTRPAKAAGIEQKQPGASPSSQAPKGIMCPSTIMKDLYAKALKVANSNASVLLRGESGTGKEVMADYIQENSLRGEGPYVKINCGALTETLLEGELFGHVKGSFTGAVGDRTGLFEAADEGTIMLDEVGEVSPALQVKLLRVLQSGEYSRVGESTSRMVNTRVIAATNRPLEKMVEEGTFRKDLYYRLNVVPIELPPLRDRREDLRELIDHFTKNFSPDAGVTYSPEAIEALESYPWPGNIRELENAIEHAIVLGDPEGITLADLPAAIQEHASGGNPLEKQRTASSMVGTASLEDIEKTCLLQALAKTRGNRTRAAKILNITRRTLGYRLRKYGLEDEVNERFGGENPD